MGCIDVDPARAISSSDVLRCVAELGLCTVSELREILGPFDPAVIRRAAADGLVGRRASGLETSASGRDREPELFLTQAGAVSIGLDAEDFPWPFRQR